MLSPKWFTKVRIVVSCDYHFTVIAMIDFSADMNCIQEGLIPSKYFEKSTERLVYTNGSQMKIKYELNNAHVCHDNVCFKIPSVLVKNMTDKGIVDNFQLSLVNKLLPPKWFTKVRIVVSHDYHFTVIVMIDSSADMNCIQEGLILSKYFEKSTERLVYTNGS